MASIAFSKALTRSGGAFAVFALLVALPSRAETWIPTSRSPYGTAYAFDAELPEAGGPERHSLGPGDLPDGRLR